MKHLSNRFDELPQDFDREAIWKGIEKPQRSSSYRYAWLLLCLLILGGVGYFWLPNSPSAIPLTPIAPKTTASKQTTTETSTKAAPYSSSTVIPNETTPTIPQEQGSATLAKTPTLASHLSIPTSKTPTTTTDNISKKSINPLSSKPSTPNKHKITPSISNRSNVIPPPAAQNAGQSKIQQAPNSATLTLTDLLPNGPLELLKSDAISSYIKPIQTYRRKRQFNRISLQAGMGSHQSRFFSSKNGLSELRSRLETEQIDYHLALRYERILTPQFFLSLQLGYQLYKDKIFTSFLDNTPNIPEQIDYRLFNHYHSISSQVALGYRLSLNQFFIDLEGGVGMDFFEIPEVHFFYAEGELARLEQNDPALRKRSNFYAVGSLAVGQFITRRQFVKLGIQVQSPLKLTTAEAEISHELLPFRGFIAFGTSF